MKPENYVNTKWWEEREFYKSALESALRAEREIQRKKHLSDVAFVNQNGRGK